MDEMLKVEELKMYFGGLKAIDDFSMSVYDKETLGIIGPNGAGKTTLFNQLTGSNQHVGNFLTQSAAFINRRTEKCC